MPSESLHHSDLLIHAHRYTDTSTHTQKGGSERGREGERDDTFTSMYM